jgi:TolB protein
MHIKKYSKLKVTLLSVFTVSLVAGCKINDADTKLPFSIVYGSKTAQDKNKSIYISDEEGKRRIKIVGATLSDGYPAVSPSGKQLAFYGKYDKFKTWSIHTVNLDGQNVRRLTHKKNVWDSSPTWSPDGQMIAFAREYRGDDGQFLGEIWLMNADGTNKQQIKALKGSSPEFMPDGRLLYQTMTEPSQISIANIDGTEITQLTNDDSNNYHAKISPDGKQIAYLANRDGNQEVYVMDINGSNQRRITKNYISEWDPAWSLDGSKVLFSSQNVHGFYDIYKANKDGSQIEKVVENASQAAGLFGVNSTVLEALMDNISQ